jgi:hypothetical protein
MPTLKLVKSERASVLSTMSSMHGMFSFSQNLNNKGKNNNEKKKKKKQRNEQP